MTLAPLNVIGDIKDHNQSAWNIVTGNWVGPDKGYCTSNKMLKALGKV